MKKWIIFIATILSLYSNVARADILEDAIDAHYKGNHAQALELLSPIAEEGNAIAQGLLGQMYLRGEGVNQDYQQAVKWFLLAAEQWDAYSQGKLGGMYDAGLGVVQDNKEAVKWLQLAAEQGEVLAQTALAWYVISLR
jgi:TPR repeat protein